MPFQDSAGRYTFFIMRSANRRSLLVRFLALFLTLGQLGWALPAHARETLRPAGLEESNPETKNEFVSRLTEAPSAGLEEGADPRPNRIVFEISPGGNDPVEMALPTGEEVRFRVRKGRVEITPGASMASRFITYRHRSLQPGAVFGYTQGKTGNALRMIRSGDPYWRPVGEVIYFFPIETVEKLRREETDLKTSPERWRKEAPYVFSDLGKREDGTFLVELRYREVPAPEREPGAAGLEEEVSEILHEMPRAEGTAKAVLIGEKALEGSAGQPPLWPLLVEAAPALTPEERRQMVIHTQDEALGRLLDELGYRTAADMSLIQAMLPEGGVTWYTTVGESVRWRGALPEVSVTILLDDPNVSFAQALAGLLKLLGYVPPEPEELQPLADALRQAA